MCIVAQFCSVCLDKVPMQFLKWWASGEQWASARTCNACLKINGRPVWFPPIVEVSNCCRGRDATWALGLLGAVHIVCQPILGVSRP